MGKEIIGIQYEVDLTNIDKAGTLLASADAKAAALGRTVTDAFGKAGTAADEFKTKAENAFKPTISRHWENETDKLKSAVKGAENQITNSFTKTTGLINAGADSLKRITENYRETKNAFEAAPNIGLYDQIEKSRLAAQKLNGLRIDAGKFDGLTKAGVRLQSELGRLQTDVRGINAELSRTTDKTVIKILNQDLIVAQNRAEQLDRQLRRLANRPVNQAANPSNIPGAAGRAKGNMSEIGQGVLSGMGFAGSMGTAGFVAAGVYGAGRLGQEIFQTTTEAEKRAFRLNSVVVELGLSYQKTAAEAVNFGNLSYQSLDDAAASYTEILRLTKETTVSNKDLSASIVDVAAKRGIEGDKLTSALEKANSGIASTELFGKNGAAIFDQYAASIGKTTDALTAAEKRQALANNLLQQGALSAGTAADKINSLTGKSEQLGKTWDNLLGNIGKNATPAVLAVLGLLNTTLSGGDVQGSPYDQIQPRIDENQAKKLHKTILDNFRSNQKEIADALTDPNKNLTNFAYSRFLDRSNFNSVSVEKQNEAKLEAITKANEFLTNQRGIFERATNSKNMDFMEDAQNVLKDQRGLFSPEEYQKFSKGIAGAISSGAEEGFRITLQRSKSLAELQRLLSDVTNSKRLDFGGKQGLMFSVQQKIEQEVQKIKALKNDFRDFMSGSIAAENPFVKLFSDMDTAAERMREKFKDLGEEYVQMVTKIEQNNIAKKIASARFESQSRALTLEQDAVRISRIRDDQFSSFQRSLELVEKKVDFVAKMNGLNRQIDESRFYAFRYNPNNPQSFDESRFNFAERDRFAEVAGNRLRGESVQDFQRRRDEAVKAGIQIQDALKDIEKLKLISLENTGVLGQAAVANQILTLVPKAEDLLKQLQSPYIGTRDDAQYLLGQRANALTVLREAESKKLQDFIYDQETAGLNRKFARQQIDLLNEQTDLPIGEKAKRYLDITKNLGNDIDPQMRRGMFEASIVAAQEERNKEREAMDVSKQIVAAVSSINAKLDAVIGSNGLKVDAPPAQVFVNAKDFDVTETLGKSGTNEDTRNAYGSNFEFGNYG